MKHRSYILVTLLAITYLSANAQIRRMNPDRNGVGNPTSYNNSGFGNEGEFNNGIINQNGEYTDGNESNRTTWGRDSTKHQKETPIPMGQFHWVLEPRLGTIIDAENNDTVVHNFQNWNCTDGYQGQYNYLGNIGAPRLNRIFMEREENDDFMFLKPFSYFRDGLQDFRFTNTLSPITNLAYHSCGNNQNGEDRIRAYFASNINKIAGIGFKIDYLYGRGYYSNSANSMFGGTGYGYYRGDRYNAHAYFNLNHMKMYENGGIENDNYIENPQSFAQSYSSTEIPVMLTETWNKNHENKYYFTHKYNIGFDREIEIPDSLKATPPPASELLSVFSDSIRAILRTDSVARAHAVDSLTKVWESNQIIPTEFIPVASIMHTLEVNRLQHTYLAHTDPKKYYSHLYFGSPGYTQDCTKALSVRNTFGLAMREGFNKWAQMGITLFATHKLRTYNLLDDNEQFNQRYTENDISIGGEVARTQGKLIHYNINGELWLVGPNIGNFAVDGNTNFEFRLGSRDSLLMDLHASVKHEKPDFFFRHYHSMYSWWDNDDLDRELRTRVEGVLRLKKMGTKLKVGVENITNYTFFGMTKTPLDANAAPSIIPRDYSNAVSVRQAGSNIQVFSASLGQDLKLGPFHWDTELTYQKTSSDDLLPLPQFNAYTNLYLLFRIAKVLRVQLGGDLRYFTSYYAPEWSPSIQQFAVQDTNQPRVEIGNYPIINAYANLHIKHCRIYMAVKHVNAGNGRAYLAPHYALNPLTIHFGVSWNFFN